VPLTILREGLLMLRLILAPTMALTLTLALALPGAQAQVPVTPRGVPGYMTPPVSPYINLLRRGSPAAVNYYGIVRPEIQFENALGNLQQQVTTLGTETGEAGPGGLPPTGHPVQFMNYSHYFGAPLNAVGGSRSARSTTPPANPPPTAAPRTPTRINSAQR
jgi:hypothetical protein